MSGSTKRQCDRSLTHPLQVHARLASDSHMIAQQVTSQCNVTHFSRCTRMALLGNIFVDAHSFLKALSDIVVGRGHTSLLTSLDTPDLPREAL
jgi:hypothetical protein